MKLIAHRGNTKGPDPDNENKPEYIQKALDAGFDVEVDVWSIDNLLYLGHDGPQYIIDFSFLKDRKKNLWIHAKNFEALIALYKEEEKNLIYFVHDKETHVLTSPTIFDDGFAESYIWTYPNNELSEHSICVMPEWYIDPSTNKRSFEYGLNLAIDKEVYGLCSDYVDLDILSSYINKT